MKKTAKKLLTQTWGFEFWITVAVFIVLSFVVLPTPQFENGLLGHSMLQALYDHPAYADMVRGVPSEAALVENVDLYNQYLIQVIVTLPLYFIAIIALYSLGKTLVWNYVISREMSLSALWKGLLSDIVYLIVVLPLGFVVILLFGVFSQLISRLSLVTGQIFFLLLVSAFVFLCVHLYLSLQFHLYTTKQFRKAVYNVFSIFDKKQLLPYGYVSVILILGLLGINLFGQFMPVQITSLLSMVVVIFLFSWLHVAVVKVVEK
jgi:hypothetical protein